jgi:hypothetical protein
MVVLLTHVLCPRKKHVSHLTSAARLACSIKVLPYGIFLMLWYRRPAVVVVGTSS